MCLVIVTIVWNSLLDPFVHFVYHLPTKKHSNSDKQMRCGICQRGARSLSLSHIPLRLQPVQNQCHQLSPMKYKLNQI